MKEERTVTGDQQQGSISVVIPARNESANIVRCLESIHDAIRSYGGSINELLVIDDGSNDDTGTLAQRSGATVIRHESSQGVLSSWIEGYNSCSSDLIIFVDADCIIDVLAFSQLAKNFSDRTVGLVSGKIAPLEPPSNVWSLSAKFSCLIVNELRQRIDNHNLLAIGRLLAVRRVGRISLDERAFPCDLQMANYYRSLGYNLLFDNKAVVYYSLETSLHALRADWQRTRASTELRSSADVLELGMRARIFYSCMVQAPVAAVSWTFCHFLLSIGPRSNHIDWSRWGPNGDPQ